MNLFELFDSQYPYKWVSKKPGYWRATFEVDGAEYAITAEVDSDGWAKPNNMDEELPNCDLSFGLTSDGFSGAKVVGTAKREFAIFSTVIAAFKEFLKSEKPQFISVNASKDNSNRFALYSRMAKKLESEIHALGYKTGECLVYKHVDTTRYFDSLCFERR